MIDSKEKGRGDWSMFVCMCLINGRRARWSGGSDELEGKRGKGEGL